MKRANAREKRREVAVDVSSHQNLGRHRQTAREQRRVVACVAVRGSAPFVSVQARPCYHPVGDTLYLYDVTSGKRAKSFVWTPASLVLARIVLTTPATRASFRLFARCGNSATRQATKRKAAKILQSERSAVYFSVCHARCIPHTQRDHKRPENRPDQIAPWRQKMPSTTRR